MDDYFDLGEFILNFDPAAPRSQHLVALGGVLEAPLPKPVPWPKGSMPIAEPLAKEPSKDDLSKFHGYDAVIVTWTSAEASALASLLTPKYPTSDWYEYRHGVTGYIPLVTGKKAPFNDRATDMHRYYQCLGLYFPCRIGSKKVLLFKSGLHLAYDGPAAPVGKLMAEIAQAVKPKVFITTGTGGGIGKDVALGDVIIADKVQFDCKQQFAKETWAKSSYSANKLPNNALVALSSEHGMALTSVNASRITGARSAPKFFNGGTIVTTDFFAYDDSTNHFGLQGLGQVCDMGDAMVAKALHAFPGIKFYAIRNASDPQIDNPSKDMTAAGKQAASIYARFGGLTTAASVLAAWSIIQAL